MSKHGTWPRQSPRGKSDDQKSLIPESTERSDKRACSSGLKRRQDSHVQFGKEGTVVDAPGGFRGDGTKPPTHLQMKRKLSKPGLRMQESPFNDEVRTVRVGLQVHNISGVDPASSTFFAAFTLHVTWEKTNAMPDMPALQLHNATALERADSPVETLPPSEGSTATLCYARLFYRATLVSALDLTFYPFDLQYLRILVRVDEECQLRPLSSQSGASAVTVEPAATGGGAWRSLVPFCSIEYVRQHHFAKASPPQPQVGFIIRLQRERTPMTWLCRIPLPLVAAAATGALLGGATTISQTALTIAADDDGSDDDSLASALMTSVLLLLGMIAVRLGLTAPYGQNATLIATASAVDTSHLLLCIGFVGCVLMQAQLLPWDTLPAAAPGVASAINCSVWATVHIVAAVLLMRRAPSLDDAAPSADAG